MDITTSLQQCQQLIRAGEFASAEAECRKVLSEAPAHPGALNLLGCIQYRGDNPDEAERAYRRAIEIAPDCATLHANLGRMLAATGRPDDARACLRTACGLQPLATESRLLLARLALEQNDPDEAETRYREALEVAPGCGAAQRGLGDALVAAQRPHEAMIAYQAAIGLEPDDADSYARLARVQRALGLLDEALESHRFATAIAPADAAMRLDFAHSRLIAGDFASGWQLLEARLRLAPSTQGRPCPPWRGEPLLGKRIILRAEASCGDTLQFVRYVPQVKRLGAEVILECPPELERLLAVVRGVDATCLEADPVEADFQCPLMSLPRIMRTTAETIPAATPYLSVPPGATPCESTDFERINVGLAWRSDQTGPGGAPRGCPLHLFEPAMRMQGLSFHSLQVAPEPAEAERLKDCGVADQTAGLRDFADLAALIDSLDLVVAVDGVVAHLAAALGKPVWLVTEMDCDWRWQRAREDSPWYPTLRIFRQKRAGDCVALTGRVAIELARLVGGEAHLAGAPESENRLREEVFLPPEPLPDDDPERIFELDCHNARLSFLPGDPLAGRSLALYGEYATAELSLLTPLLHRGDIVLEAGAGVGAHTVALARLVGPPGHVLAFDRHRAHCQLLERNLRDNHIEHASVQLAVLGAQASSCHVRGLPFLAGDPGGEVPVLTLDSLGLDRLRLVKADLGGEELALLEGAAQTIERLIPILYLGNRDRLRSPALIARIQQLGYRLWWHPAPLAPAGIGTKGNVFGTRARVHLLCVPRALAAGITGLREIDAPDEWYE